MPPGVIPVRDSQGTLAGFPAGVLNKRSVEKLLGLGAICGGPGLDEMKEHESAFDLHLGKKCFELSGTMKLKDGEAVKSALTSGNCNGRLDLSGGKPLAVNKTYLVELQETINFSRYPELQASATGKSSLGRLGVLTHLVANYESRYDSICEGYVGNLYAQITPLTFPLWVKEGYALNQLRVICGNPGLSEIGGGIREFVYNDQGSNLLMIDKGLPALDAIREGFLTLSIAPTPVGNEDAIALKANKGPYSEKEVGFDTDKDAIDPEAKGAYDFAKYWTPVRNLKQLHAERGLFYIVRSLERLCLPDNVAVTCIAMTENLGDVRIHYAGFAHPWFGSCRGDGEVGTPLMFEVRCFTDQMLRHGEKFAEMRFFRMSERTVKPDKSDYDEQELMPSKGIWSAQPPRAEPSQTIEEHNHGQ